MTDALCSLARRRGLVGEALIVSAQSSKTEGLTRMRRIERMLEQLRLLLLGKGFHAEARRAAEARSSAFRVE